MQPSTPTAPTLRAPSGRDVVRVAAHACVDPKTVRRYLDGEPSLSTTRERVELALVACGLAAHVRSGD